MGDYGEGEQIANMIVSHEFVIDGSNLIHMPMIKLQRVLKQMQPSYNPEQMSYSELVNATVLVLYNHINQLQPGVKRFEINNVQIQMVDGSEDCEMQSTPFSISKYPTIAQNLVSTGELLPSILIPTDSPNHYRSICKPTPFQPKQAPSTENEQPSIPIATDKYIRRSHSRMGVLGKRKQVKKRSSGIIQTNTLDIEKPSDFVFSECSQTELLSDPGGENTIPLTSTEETCFVFSQAKDPTLHCYHFQEAIPDYQECYIVDNNQNYPFSEMK